MSTKTIISGGKEKRFSWVVTVIQRLFQFIHEAIRSAFYHTSMQDSALKEPHNKKKYLILKDHFFKDIFYVIHIIFQFRSGFIAPSSRLFGRGVLVEDLSAIAWRYLSSNFLINILAVLPLPQYVPRLIRIIPLYMEVTRSAGIITETAWAGAAFNLLLYMLASHILGAFWYLLSIQREDACWKLACSINNCNTTSWYCGKEQGQNNNFLDDACSVQNSNNSFFNFGIYIPALQNIVQSTDFSEKFFYCFWWGLQNLSSLGQNLTASTYEQS